jgi:hypothetical protein
MSCFGARTYSSGESIAQRSRKGMVGTEESVKGKTLLCGSNDQAILKAVTPLAQHPLCCSDFVCWGQVNFLGRLKVVTGKDRNQCQTNGPGRCRQVAAGTRSHLTCPQYVLNFGIPLGDEHCCRRDVQRLLSRSRSVDPRPLEPRKIGNYNCR